MEKTIMTILPKLYKPTKTGAIQVCDISYEDDKFFVTFGQLDGKMQINTTTCTPKNIGKVNETTAYQQAKLEAEAYHKKKVKSGYSTKIQKQIEIQLPQKVKVFQDNLKNITFPCYTTPKLNGVNGTYWLQPDGSLKLTSRGGEEYPPIPHLEPEIKRLMKLLDTTCLNGELYIHGEHLQDITSAVKKPKKLSKELTFNVFELPLVNKTYKEKNIDLFKTSAIWFNEDVLGKSKIKLLYGSLCKSMDDIEEHYNVRMNNGYEGIVIYLQDAPYTFNQRSSYVFKYKKTLDGEYKIEDYELDKRGHPTLICKAGDSTFKVRPKGTVAEREQILANIDSYIGSWYKIEYETLSKDGIPLKPVGIGLRDCDVDGNPLE